MVRASWKPQHHPHGGSVARLVVVALVGLLGFALVADYLWASSSRFSSSSRLGSWNKPPASIILHPPPQGGAGKDKKKDAVLERVLSATFADLPAPETKWEKMASAPVPRLDGAAIQIKNLLYVFAGYGTIDYVHSHVDIYNFTDNTWGGRFDMPKEMAHSHLGMVTDGRYIYVVTGQFGPQCRGPIGHTFVLDTETKQWRDMPPLPLPRYAPATQLWKGRLHVMGGSKENRHTPALEHWSLAVKDGKPLEKEWRSEIAIPRGGPHRACVVFDDRLYVIGGQEGDFMAKPGSPIFKCSRRNEVVFGDVYMLDDEMKWKVLPSLPKPDSHIEFAWTIVNNSLVVVGGTTEKHPVTKKMVLVGEIFQLNFDTQKLVAYCVSTFNCQTKCPFTGSLQILLHQIFNITFEKWSVIGKLPFRVKTTLVGYWNGWLYFTSGQRDRGPDNPAPRKVIGEMWRTKLKLRS
ncbi:kelch repeat-containing protein At3g27220 isoform X1 [Tripterygium wilfordii]|uniref:kelch repeat-containing protein At3g27220 isoform X1 n=1 Tax=Tripterygium wilfordii TaxID=458696 RepID=UPI0018F86187|nr:kelch repeat-containing protein At3g27220 isoform X1 [Tripterygium wilfordii]